MPQTRIGISGWRYGPWRGTFYPKGLPQRRELEYAASKLNSIEINGSFYSLQRPEYFREWYEQTPTDFLFAVKGGRFITHMKKLKNVRVPLANFLASGVLCLKEKLGPILWQFPPGFALNLERFEEFFAMLPRDTEAAAKLAREHDHRVKGRAWTKTDKKRPLRHAIEVRHESFKDDSFIRLLRRHNVAFVFADTAQRWPYAEDVTADFIYARLHGEKELYVSGYTEEALDWWASRLRTWREGCEPADRNCVAPPAKPRSGKRARGRDIYVYFDNDVKVRAPFDAMALGRRMGLTVADDRPTPQVEHVIGDLPRSRWPGFGRAGTGRS